MAENKLTMKFPQQKLPISKKGKKWGKECVDAGISMAQFAITTDLRADFKEKHANYSLINGRLEADEIRKITDPWGLEGQGVIPDLQDFPIIRPKIDLLVGESAKRQFNWNVRVVNPDAISEKEEAQKAELRTRLMEVLEQSQDEEDVQARMQELQEWSKYEMQDLRERNANMILNYLYSEQKLDTKFLKGFKDLLVAGEEIYCVDEVANEPIVRKVSPMNLFCIGMGDSPYIEDAAIIIEDSYVPLGEVINEFYEYLTSAEIDKLESRSESTESNSGKLLNYNNNEPHFPSGMVTSQEDDAYPLENYQFDADALGAAFDLNGNVRKTRVVWESLRKVGFIEYPDEDGDLVKDMVDENYVPKEDQGEDVEWKWITEWWEGTRIGNDIYVKVQPRPIQFRKMDNKSYSSSGYIGTIYNTDVHKAKSLVGILKPYQILYDEFMYRIKRAFEKFKMPQIDVDFSFVPDGWTIEKWLYYAEELGYRFKDSYKEINKGPAQGKLLGSVVQNQEKIFNPDMGNYIQQHVFMLDHIERQMSLISGVSEQRQGVVSNRETVGGIERSVLQSSHITEEYYKTHDDVKIRVMEALLETAKYAWRNAKSRKAQYIIDGMHSEIFEIDGEQFNEAEYGVMVGDSTKETQLIETLKELSHALVQRGEAGISTIIDIYMSPGLATMRRKLEAAEDKAREERMQQQEQQSKIAEQQIQQQAELKQQEIDLKKYEIDTKNAIEKMKFLASMKDDESNNEPEDKSLEIAKFIEDNERFNKEYNLKKQDLQEKIRSNKAKEQIAKQKPKTTSSNAKKR